MHLSTHFSLDEMVFSQTAARLGIDNTPSARELENLERLCMELLEPIRAHFGAVTVSSGYRCIALNRHIGSRDSSAHVDGRAADIVVNVRPLAVCHWIESSGLPFDQAIHEFGRWTHVAIAEPGQAPRRQLLTIDSLGTRHGLHEARK